MKKRLDFKDENVQRLIKLFHEECHCLKIYNVANELFTNHCDKCHEKFSQYIDILYSKKLPIKQSYLYLKSLF